jgi:hypothetical protein
VAEPIARHRGRITAVAVVVPALGLLCAHAAVLTVRRVALRFERIRKALAYLFRRQLETKAEAVGRGTSDITLLPADLQQAFDRAGETSARVDHFPELDTTADHVERLAAGGAGCAVALVGVRGTGKTTWLEELRRRTTALPVTLADLDETMEDEAAVCTSLCRDLDLDEVTTIPELCEALLAGPRRVVLLDHGQNLALRAVGGTRGFKAFARIVRRTLDRVVWVCAFSRYTWEFIEFATRGQDVFQRVIRLRAWSEERIRELVESRLDAAGYRADFGDLLDREVHELEREDALQATRERYLRLLWDYTDGVPALALHFWLRSLIATGEDEVRVRLFEGPTADRLERLGEQSRFVLNAVISHENLTVDKTARVLHYSPAKCLSLLEALRAQGYLESRDGRYRIALHWDRAAVRYLRRKHLLYS